MACEPHSCPSMSRGQYRYDFGDTTKLTPLIKMFTLGHSFVPPGIHAGGLRYHGMAPMVSLGAKLGLIEAAAFHQIECFEAAQLFAADRGHHPRPRNLARHPRGDQRGHPLPRDGRGEVHPLQLQRPRPVRHGLLRPLPQRQARGLRLSAGEDRRGHRGAAGDRVGRLPLSNARSWGEAKSNLAPLCPGGASDNSPAIYRWGLRLSALTDRPVGTIEGLHSQSQI